MEQSTLNKKLNGKRRWTTEEVVYIAWLLKVSVAELMPAEPLIGDGLTPGTLVFSPSVQRMREAARAAWVEDINDEAPAETTGADVRLKGLEPPTFWLGGTSPWSLAEAANRELCLCYDDLGGYEHARGLCDIYCPCRYCAAEPDDLAGALDLILWAAELEAVER